jgi:hypothetical protein
MHFFEISGIGLKWIFVPKCEIIMILLSYVSNLFGSANAKLIYFNDLFESTDYCC